ncbi:hypothetical protein Dxin01_02644 [Deinococcus xinjiangensis]|uniref:Uncharacterized protein n=1 Tax=Deinococcus xinjiangensis TaxID=457454 RepID=A0ABP9VGS5_9DEIO
MSHPIYFHLPLTTSYFLRRLTVSPLQATRHKPHAFCKLPP